eukprot:1691626-Rhodomonas_salina.3
MHTMRSGQAQQWQHTPVVVRSSTVAVCLQRLGTGCACERVTFFWSGVGHVVNEMSEEAPEALILTFFCPRHSIFGKSDSCLRSRMRPQPAQ